MSLSYVEEMLDKALNAVAGEMKAKFGAVNIETGKPDPGGQGIPQAAVEPLTECIMSFAANLIQEWLDAGSEREVTYEELDEPVRQHIAGWVPIGDNKSLADTEEYKAERRATALWRATYEGVTPEELQASLADYKEKSAISAAHGEELNRQWEAHRNGEETEMFGIGA